MLSYQWNEEEAREAWKEVGKEEGISIGEERGRREGQRDIVKNMKSAGMDIDFIAKVSGWSAEQIAAI